MGSLIYVIPLELQMFDPYGVVDSFDSFGVTEV